MKDFSKQSRECKKNGTQFEEECNWCSHDILMCRKYGGQCMSSKCREEREKEKP